MTMMNMYVYNNEVNDDNEISMRADYDITFDNNNGAQISLE